MGATFAGRVATRSTMKLLRCGLGAGIAVAAMFVAECVTQALAEREPAADGSDRQPGLIGIVFDNPALAKPVRVWTQPDASSEHFVPIIRRDFSLTLRGQLAAPAAGALEVRARSDGGVRVRLNGATIIDAWAPGGSREGKAVAATKEPLPFELDYFHDGGVASLALEWRAAGGEWTRIPASAFSTTAEQRAAAEKGFAELMSEFEKDIVEVANPHPAEWPTMRFVQQGARPLLRTSFPNAPDFTCDSWMYESEMDFLGARDIGEGRMEVRHRLRATPDVLVVSTVTPGPGFLEIVARTEHEDGSAAALPQRTPPPDLCWQLRHAAGFSAYPEPYELFAARCFVFTKDGYTTLDKTRRLPTTRFPADDPINNPPWVQVYLPSWAGDAPMLPFAWAGVSPDRVTATVAGVISRDGKHLAAIANDSATSISQVWVDCLHNDPEWRRSGGADSPATWRLKIYVMENDPDALLRRVAIDFPDARLQPGMIEAATGLPVTR